MKTQVLYITGCPPGTKERLKAIGKMTHRSMSKQALAFLEEGAKRFEEKHRPLGGDAA